MTEQTIAFNEAPVQPEETLDPHRQQKAKEYAKIKRRLSLLDLGLGAAYLLLFIVSGGSPWLRDQIHQITQATWLSVPLFALAFGLPYSILTAPLNFYSGYILPHRYGQSTQTIKGWLLDQAKGMALAGVFGLIVLEIIYLLLGVAPQTWWLWMAVVMLFFTVLLSNLAPVLIFPLFFKYKPLEDEALVSRLKQLADRVGAQVQGVYVFDMSSKTVAANAAVMGLGNTR
ncbi:MAG: hypothetical protein R3264_01950, partial [Anaerolineae bacterium]|nr:hypothetical protein [Anaerolineae bacterium]